MKKFQNTKLHINQSSQRFYLQLTLLAVLGITGLFLWQTSANIKFNTMAAAQNALPDLSVGDAAIVEGKSEYAPEAVFNITLSSADREREISVEYVLFNFQSGVPPAESQRGTLVFAPGETARSVSIPILFTRKEGVQKFRLQLFEAVNARIDKAEGFGSLPVRIDADKTKIENVFVPAAENKVLSQLFNPTDNLQAAILGIQVDGSTALNRGIIFPNANSLPTPPQTPISSLPASNPHGVAYFGSDNAMISDFGGSRIFVVQISTAALLATISTAAAPVYDGTGTIAVAPNLSAALAIGESNQLQIIRGPFNASSPRSAITLPGRVESYQTQAIVFDNTGRAFVYHSAGISILDAPYTSIAFTIPVTGNASTGAIAISPNGGTLLTTILSGTQVRIFQAPFSSSTTSTLLTIPSSSGLDGIAITPDGTKAIVVSAFVRQAAAISAPFSAASTVEQLPIPTNAGTAGFEDVGISADSQIAVLTGNGTAATDLPVFVRTPFTAAGAQLFAISLQNGAGGFQGRGAGSIRFLPPGLAPGLTISKSAAAYALPGANLTYTISYSNTGSTAATGVVIRDPLPAGTTFVSAANGGTLSSGSVVFNIGAVSAGAGTQTVSFTVNIPASTTATLVSNNNYTIEGTAITPISGPPVVTSLRSAQFDFDGDRRADISVFRPSNGTWYVQQSQAGFTGLAFGFGTDRLVPADYDGDGKTDVAVFRSGTWYIQRSSLGFFGLAFGASDDIPVPADYDGDGRADIAVFRPSNGTWYLQRSSLGFTGTAFGQNGDRPVAADYDGDGKADIAVNRAGTWYLLRSQLGFTGFAFGDGNDKLVPADYDGDGKTDVAVFRPSNGFWYLLQSTAGFTGLAFGLGSDLPVAADFDGDGKADVSVFRNGTWYLQRSTQGFTGFPFGASTDLPIPNAFVR